jgi:hypothetical protein
MENQETNVELRSQLLRRKVLKTNKFFAISLEQSIKNFATTLLPRGNCINIQERQCALCMDQNG